MCAHIPIAATRRDNTEAKLYSSLQTRKTIPSPKVTHDSPPPHPIPFTHSFIHSRATKCTLCNICRRGDTAPIVFLVTTCSFLIVLFRCCGALSLPSLLEATCGHRSLSCVTHCRLECPRKCVTTTHRNPVVAAETGDIVVDGFCMCFSYV